MKGTLARISGVMFLIFAGFILGEHVEAAYYDKHGLFVRTEIKNRIDRTQRYD